MKKLWIYKNISDLGITPVHSWCGAVGGCGAGDEYQVEDRRQDKKKRRKDSSTSSFFALCSLYTRRSVGLVFWIWMCWTKCQFKFIACSREYIEMYVLHRIIYTLYIVSSSLDLFLVWSCIILTIFDAKYHYESFSSICCLLSILPRSWCLMWTIFY